MFLVRPSRIVETAIRCTELMVLSNNSCECTHYYYYRIPEGWIEHFHLCSINTLDTLSSMSFSVLTSVNIHYFDVPDSMSTIELNCDEWIMSFILVYCDRMVECVWISVTSVYRVGIERLVRWAVAWTSLYEQGLATSSISLLGFLPVGIWDIITSYVLDKNARAYK